MSNTFKITGNAPSSASTAAVGSEVTGLSKFSKVNVRATFAGNTGGTLDVYLQRFDGSNWVDWVHFAQKAAGAAATSVSLEASSPSLTVTTVGLDATPALAAGAVTGGHPGDKVRCLAVSGASTSAGAAIVITLSGVRA